MAGESSLLRKLQQRFQQHLLVPQADQLEDVIAATPQVPRETRLQIYSNAYRERLVAGLANICRSFCGKPGRIAIIPDLRNWRNSNGPFVMHSMPPTRKSSTWTG
jgi:hypothetical protein